MIGIIFDPAKLTDPAQQKWWQDWQQDADNATATLINRFENWFAGNRGAALTFSFQSRIWKELKDWLMKNVFNEKCAYCERLISGYYGDAEHFRPKGALKFKDDAGELVGASCDVVDPGSGNHFNMTHPGYFWLAYDWRNLVPSCVYCNSGQGKNERFDTAQGHVLMVELDPAAVAAIPPDARPRASRWPRLYYPTPGMLEQLEGPLFLNPLNPPAERDPRRHLRFGHRGTVAALKGSAAALTTMEVFRLKDEELRKARQKAQEDFQSRYYDAMRDFNPQGRKSKAQTVLDEYKAGKHPFSAAALDYYRILYESQPEPV